MGKAVQRPVAKGKKSDEFKVLVELATVGLFSSIAVATGHEHWLKEANEVRPITGPILRYIDSLPKSAQTKLEKNLNPALFVIGVGVVLGPDIATEIRIRRYGNPRQAERPGPQGPPVGPIARNVGQGVRRPDASSDGVDGAYGVAATPQDLVGITY